MGTETRPQPKEPEHLSCRQCRKEIPPSAVTSAEGEEYLMHFCGVDCAEEWRRRHENKER